MKLELEIPELPMTPEDFEKLPEVEGVRFELVEGDLLVMNAAYVRHRPGRRDDLYVPARADQWRGPGTSSGNARA